MLDRLACHQNNNQFSQVTNIRKCHNIFSAMGDALSNIFGGYFGLVAYQPF